MLQSRLQEKRIFEFNAHDIITSSETVRGCYVEIDELWYQVKSVEPLDRNNIVLVLETGESKVVTSFRKYKFSKTPQTPKASHEVWQLVMGTKVPGHISEYLRRFVDPHNVVIIHDERFAKEIHFMPKPAPNEIKGDPLSFGTHETPIIAIGAAYCEDFVVKINNVYYRCRKDHVATKELMQQHDYLVTHWKML